MNDHNDSQVDDRRIASAMDCDARQTESWWWFEDGPCRGSWNMAVDEALLESAAADNQPVLRFYQWEAPTLSLGYFQPYGDRRAHTASLNCAVVRRTTGGGAILHHHELTYSCVVPRRHRLAKRAGDLYRAIHTAVVDVVAAYGATAQLYACQPPADGRTALANEFSCAADPSALGLGRAASPEPFLCFQRRAGGDVVLAEWKIAGSAQRRERGAVLQHGSIILRRSSFAPELPGIAEIARLSLVASEFAERLRAAAGVRLGAEFHAQTLNLGLQKRAAEIEKTKFRSPAWLTSR
jgi:lipoate-protein ligase A